MAKRTTKKTPPPPPIEEEEIEEEYEEEEEEPEYEEVEVVTRTPQPPAPVIVPKNDYAFLKMSFKLVMMLVYFLVGALLFFLVIGISLIPLGIFEAFSIWFLRFQGVHI